MNRLLLIILPLLFCQITVAQDGKSKTGTLKVQKKDSVVQDTVLAGGWEGRTHYTLLRAWKVDDWFQLSLSGTSNFNKTNSLGSVGLRYGSRTLLGLMVEQQFQSFEGNWTMAGIYLRYPVTTIMIGPFAPILIVEVNDAFGIYDHDRKVWNDKAFNKYAFAAGINIRTDGFLTWELMVEYQIITSKTSQQNGAAMTLRIYF